MRITSILAVMLILPGCSMWTRYNAPAVETPDRWEQQINQPDNAAWPEVQWWQHFGSDELNMLIVQGQKSNYDMAAAIARVKEADAQARIAGAGLLPSVELEADANRNRIGSSDSTNGAGNARISNNYAARLNASYELDFWGKNSAALAASDALAEASRYDKETVQLTITSSIATSYFDILAFEERLTVAQNNLKAANELLDAIKRRYTEGLVSQLDVAQQENFVAVQQAALPALVLQLRQSRNALAILVGKLPEDLTFTTDKKIADLSIPQVAAGLPSELLTRRPDIKTSEMQLAAAHADIVAARAAFFPSIALTGDAGYQTAALSQLFRPESMLWSIGSSLMQPIFEGGLLTGQLEYRKARYDELLSNYRKTIISAFSDVENALTAVAQYKRQEQSQLEAMQSAKLAFELSKRQFDAGITDITTVLNTQRAWFSAQDGFIQARLSSVESIVGLYKALGGGWQDTSTNKPN